jgi:hypothetical protein
MVWYLQVVDTASIDFMSRSGVAERHTAVYRISPQVGESSVATKAGLIVELMDSGSIALFGMRNVAMRRR